MTKKRPIPPENPWEPNDIADVDARDLEHLVTSRGYTQFFQPLLIGLMRRCYKELANPSVKRRWDKPDNFLRGAIWLSEKLLEAPDAIIAAKAADLLQNAAPKEDPRYAEAAHGGMFQRDRAEINADDPI